MAAYPKIDDLDIIVTQFPYTEVDEHAVSSNSMDCGISYTYEENAFRLKRFHLTYDVITRAQAAIIEDFFLEMRGRLGEFEFTDDADNVWTATRFDQDELKVEYVAPGHMKMEVKLFAEWDPSQTE